MRITPLKASLAFAAAGALGSALYLLNRTRLGPVGSQTNASDAMDDIELHPRATREEIVDAGVKHTFPASDPVAVGQAVETAHDREQRLRRDPGQRALELERERAAQAPAPRSADWMLAR